MRKSKYSEHQIVGALKRAEAGVSVKDICRDLGISAATFYQWCSKYGGLEASDLKRLKDLETMSADGSFDKISKKEGLMLTREMEKLERSLGGIKNMRGIPDAMFVVDVGHEKIAVSEARKLGIPVIGVAAATMSAHRPIASNMRWVLRESAVERSSKLGCSAAWRATGSMTATRRPSGASASARLEPIMPPPAMTMSYFCLMRRASAPRCRPDP